MFCDGS
jgi:ribonuclease HI